MIRKAISGTSAPTIHGRNLLMTSAVDLRRIALSLDGTNEVPHFDRIAFKVVRIYATLAADGAICNLKFTPDEQELKCLLAPEVFTPVRMRGRSKGGRPFT
jgi:hypothetical protein